MVGLDLSCVFGGSRFFLLTIFWLVLNIWCEFLHFEASREFNFDL